MEFGRNNVRQMVEEDRLSSLPDELIHKILSSFDMRFAVQTCVLSSRWKLLWTSMPCLNFSSNEFDSLLKFAEFVSHVLSHHNHQIDASFVKLEFEGAGNEVFVEKIAKYVISHNVQDVTVVIWPDNVVKNYPACLFSSQSLKHYTVTVEAWWSNYIELDAPLDFPALTTMHLSGVSLCGDIFSKCVNLKNLTLQDFWLEDVKVLDIISPQLSSLMLIGCYDVKVINLVAPQLESLTATDCFSIKYFNAPPGLLSLCLKDFWFPLQFSKDGFHSLYKVTLCLCPHGFRNREEDAREIIKMLQEVHSARHLTLSADIIECLSSFPGLLLPRQSPFSNLISLTIDYSMRKDTYKVTMSTEAINFLLKNSPSAKYNLELHKDPSRR